MSIKVIYEKYTNGDALTNAELKQGYEHFSDLANMLLLSGPVFTLAFKEARRVEMAFEGYMYARGLKK